MNESLVVSLQDIVVDFDGERILDGLSLDIHDKEFVTFLGAFGLRKNHNSARDCRLFVPALRPCSV